MKNIIFMPLTLQLPNYCKNCIFNRCHICHLRLHGTTFYHCPCYQKPYCHRIPCKNIYFFELSESEKEIVVIL